MEDMNQENIESFFGIPVFSFEKNSGMTDTGFAYGNVTFLADSLKQFDGCDVEVTFDWTLELWSNTGDHIYSVSLIDVPEFQQAILQKISSSSNS